MQPEASPVFKGYAYVVGSTFSVVGEGEAQQVGS